MRITLISRAWPPSERSGVSLAAMSHAKLLLQQGHDVSIIGAENNLQAIPLPLSGRTCVPAKGSGSLYSPARINQGRLKQAIASNKPELVIVEAWQTALTDSAIDVAYQLGIPVLMISHGISMHPYKVSIPQYLRSLAWLPYRYLRLPGLVKKLNAITTLDESSKSNRFFDRELAKKCLIPVVVLKNYSAHQMGEYVPRSKRQMQILVVGYFFPVKNQLAAINLMARLPFEISCCFIGDRQGRYFEECRTRVIDLKLNERISFLQDDECNLAQKIAHSILIFSPSITEVLPITLIEAMECGTPFVGTSVGAVKGFWVE